MLTQRIAAARQRQAMMVAMMPRHFQNEEPLKSFAADPETAVAPASAGGAGGGLGSRSGPGALALATATVWLAALELMAAVRISPDADPVQVLMPREETDSVVQAEHEAAAVEWRMADMEQARLAAVRAEASRDETVRPAAGTEPRAEAVAVESLEQESLEQESPLVVAIAGAAEACHRLPRVCKAQEVAGRHPPLDRISWPPATMGPVAETVIPLAEPNLVEAAAAEARSAGRMAAAGVLAASAALANGGGGSQSGDSGSYAAGGTGSPASSAPGGSSSSSGASGMSGGGLRPVAVRSAAAARDGSARLDGGHRI